MKLLRSLHCLQVKLYLCQLHRQPRSFAFDPVVLSARFMCSLPTVLLRREYAYARCVLCKSKVLALMQDQRHDAEEEKDRMEQEFRNSAETKTTIPAMWRPLA